MIDGGDSGMTLVALTITAVSKGGKGFPVESPDSTR